MTDEKEFEAPMFNRFSTLGIGIPEGTYDEEWLKGAFETAVEGFIGTFKEDWNHESAIRITIVAEYDHKGVVTEEGNDD